MPDMNEVYIMLDMHCSMRCKVCPYWGDRGVCYDESFRKKYSKRLDPRAVCRFIDEISSYKPRTITLSGGEPLEYEGWAEIARYAKRKGQKVALSTNAIHMRGHMKDILRYVDNVQVSIPGTRDIWEETRDSANYFDRVVDNIRILSRHRKGRRPFIRSIYVLSGKSYRKALELYRELQGTGIDNFFFQHVMYIDEESLAKHRSVFKEFGFEIPITSGFCIDPGEIDIGLMQGIVEELKGKDDVTVSPELSVEELRYYYDPRQRSKMKRGMRCRALDSQVDLYPNGDIMVCPDLVIGNIFENGFREIWEGQRIEEVRRYIRKNGRFPGCQSCFYYYVSNEDI